MDKPDPIDIHVGSRVRLRRNVLNLSQEKLGASIGLTFQQVQKYERGANRISASRLHELGQVMGVPAAWFFEGIEARGGSEAAAGFAEAPAAAFDADPMGRDETIELVNAYYEIDDAGLRKRFVELAKGLASQADPTREA